MGTTTIRTHSNSAPWLGLAGWSFPGAGHLLQGRIWRGVIIAITVLCLYILGLTLGGHIFSVVHGENGLISYVFGFCDLGSGFIYVACNVLGIGAVDQAWRSTAEYGNIFLMLAGLLNYLAMLDSFDIAVGRKL